MNVMPICLPPVTYVDVRSVVGYLVAHGRYESALVADVEDALALREPASEQVLLGDLELFDALGLEDGQLHRLLALVEVRVVDQSHTNVRRLPQLHQSAAAATTAL